MLFNVRYKEVYLTTLQGTNISPKNGIFEDDFPFPKVGYVSSMEGIYLVSSVDFIKYPKNPDPD